LEEKQLQEQEQEVEQQQSVRFELGRASADGVNWKIAPEKKELLNNFPCIGMMIGVDLEVCLWSIESRHKTPENK
jgi:hypothetical protein